MPRSGLNVSLESVDLDGPWHDSPDRDGPGRDGSRLDLRRRSGAADADDRRVNNGRNRVLFDYDSRDSGWRDAGSRDPGWRYDPPHDPAQRDRHRPQNPRRTKSPATVIDAAPSGRSAVPPARTSPPRPRSPSSPRVSSPPRPTGPPATHSPARRTIIIQGRGAERSRPSPTRRAHVRRRHERHGFRPDRAAMWAVLLGVVLVLVAATSSHAAVRTIALPKPRTQAAPAAHTAAPAMRTPARPGDTST